MTTNTYTKAFAPLLKGWQVKAMGTQPTEAMLANAVMFSPHRKVGPQTLALAMRMRPEGVTQRQQGIACGAPQNNFSRHQAEAGYFKRDTSVSRDDHGHTVYKFTLTPKGEAAIAKRKAADDAAVLTGDAPKAKVKAKAKGDAPAKPRKPKVSTAPVSEAPAAVTDAGEAPAATPAADTAN